MPSLSPLLRAAGADALALLLAATCAGCDEPGTMLCEGCRVRLRASPRELHTPAGLRVVAATAFESVAARCIRRLKDAGETVVARPLGRVLRGVLRTELADSGVGGLARAVPVPTSRRSYRRRGYRVPELLIRSAGEDPLRLLSLDRRGVDQRGLDAGQRSENVHGSMSTRRSGRGEPIVLVDDVMTTGSTFDEAARALEEAGFEVVSAVALAATPRLSERNANASGTRRK
ncbi:ComF family protein [Microbacterium sp.]|uniref:ComF family protein n=1 Tax=Microbacterium sp. TaxID=51671 RepID=UPI003568766C